MERVSSLLRRLGLFFLVLNIFLPFSIDSAFAQEEDQPRTGGITIVLIDSSSGGAIGGGSFTVVDANGGIHQVNGDGDGYTDVWELAVGPATVTQTGAPGGYQLGDTTKAANVSAENPDGVTFANTLIPPPDSDGDGIPDSQDSTPTGDSDSDGVDNAVDACPGAADSGFDTDSDGADDACDATPNGDNDGDGFDNLADNCVDKANADQSDSDGDGAGDACDTPPPAVIENDPVTGTIANGSTGTGATRGIQGDTDDDGVADNRDNCVDDPNKDQLDTDSDMLGDLCDNDDDGDTVIDTDDCAPIDPAIFPGATDVPGDGIDQDCSGADAEDTSRVAALDTLTGIGAQLKESGGGNTPATECASIGMVFVTKLDGIPDPGGDGPHTYSHTTVEGPADGGTASVTWSKNPNELTIDSTSFDYDGYVEKRGNGGGLSHVTFCKEPASITVIKQDQGGSLLSGVEFELYEGSDSTGTLVGTETTNDDGVAVFTDVEIGTVYTVHEVAAPTGCTPGADAQVTPTESDPYPDVTVVNQCEDSAEPSVDLEKVAAEDPIAAGEDLVYTITLTNSGNANATGAGFTDDLPLTGFGWTWTENGTPSGDLSTPNCSLTGANDAQQSLTCTGIDLTTSGAGSTFTVVVTSATGTDPDDCHSYDNTAVPTDFTDTNPNNNSDSTLVTCSSSVVIEKSASAPVDAGNPISFTITVRNDGNGAAEDVAFTDTLPEVTGHTWTIVNAGSIPAGIICDIDVSRVLSCTGIDLDPSGGTFDAFSVTVQSDTEVDSTNCGDYKNTASLSGGYTGDSLEATATVNCDPNVTIAKVAIGDGADGTIVPGEDLQFQITVTNTGNEAATGVTFTDDLPEVDGQSWTFVENPTGTDAVCTYDNDDPTDESLSCSGIDLAADNGSFVVTLTSATATDGTTCGPFVNTVSLDGIEEPTGDNSATITVNCTTSVDITKSCPDTTGLAVDDPISYTVTVHNTGNVDLTNVNVTDARTEAGAAFFDDADDVPGDDPSVGFPPTIGAGDTVVRYFKTTIQQLDANNGNVNNSVTVTADELNLGGQPVFAGEGGVCPFTPITGLTVTKSCPVFDTGVTPRVGDDIEYVITIENTGDIAFNIISIIDTRSTTGSFEEDLLPTSVGPRDTVTLHFLDEIQYGDATAGNLNNTVTVNGAFANNEVAVTRSADAATGGTTGCPFTPFADIDITKTCPEVPAGTRVGTEIVYTVRIENTGDLAFSTINVTEDRTGVGDNDGFSPVLPDTLDPGEVYEGTFTTEVTGPDAGLGSINNHIEVEAFVAESARQPQEIASLFGTVVNVPDASDSDDADCGFTPFSEVTISKACPTLVGGGEPNGSPIDTEIIYEITITNTGDTVQTVSSLDETGRTGTFHDDSAGTSGSPFPITLQPEGSASDTSATVYFKTSILDSDVDNGTLDNQVSVTTDEGVTASFSTATGIQGGCSFTPFVDYTISKSCPDFADGTGVGDTIVYQVTVTNTGDGDLTGVTVTDSRGDEGAFFEDAGGATASGFPGVISPDDGPVTRYYITTIQQGDADSGNARNTVTIDADQFVPFVTSAGDGEEGCPFDPVATFTVDKACPDTAGKRVDDQIVYPVKITNTGDVDISIITLGETRSGTFYTSPTDFIEANEVSLPLAVDAGVNTTVYFVDTVDSDDASAGNINNTVTVTGQVQIGEGAPTVLDPVADAAGDGQAGCLFTPFVAFTVYKSCPEIADGALVGSDIVYPISITNFGDTEIVLNQSDITEHDRTGTYNLSADGTGDTPFPLTLDPSYEPGDGNQETIYFTTKILQTDANNGNVDNSVTVTANGVYHTVDAAQSETPGCPFVPVATFTVDKACPDTTGLGVTSQIIYPIKITNTGDVDVSIINLVDSRDGGTFYQNADLSGEITGDFLVARGGSLTIYFVDTIDSTDASNENVNNQVTVTGEGVVGNGNPVEIDPVVAHAGTEGEIGCLYDPVTGFDVTKACPDTTGLGVTSQVIYPVTIENTGEVNVNITDLEDSRTDGTFYTSNTDLTDVNKVTEDFIVAPGASVTVYFVDTIDGQDAINGNVDNTVTVSGEALFAEGGPETLTPVVAHAMNGDTEGCPFSPDTGIDITKGCPVFGAGVQPRLGNSITYEVTVTNTGEVPLTGISLTDDRTGDFYLQPDDTTAVTMPLPGVTLAPAGENGDAITLYFTSTITPTDVTNGNLDNSADVSATATVGGTGSTISDSGSAIGCTFDPVESVSITKSCPEIAPNTRVGQSITYNITIENTGDVPLTNIQINDQRDGSLTDPFTEPLDPDDPPMTRTFTSTITLQDALNGNVDNIVDVDADAITNSGTVVVSDSFDTATDTETGCGFDPVESVSIVKECPTIADDARAGSYITYKVTLTNDGDVPLSSVNVTDPTRPSGAFFLNTDDDPETATANDFPGTLAVDDPDTAEDEGTVVRYFKTKITTADAAADNVDNSVEVTAKAISGGVSADVSGDSSVQCAFDPTEGVTITKSCPDVANETRVGATIIYPVTITNTGDVALTGIDVSDIGRTGTFHTDANALTTALTMPLPSTTLAPAGEDGDEITIYFKTTITLADAANGTIDNTVKVEANADEVGVDDTFTATGATCQFVPLAGIEITKTCPTISDGTRVGAEITYQVTITNVGDIPLDITSVTDDRGDGFESAFPDVLAPEGQDNDEATRTFTDQITYDDAANGNVDNYVSVNTAQGVSDSFDTSANNDGTGCRYTPVTGIEITKSCPEIADDTRVGAEISYIITVKNTGDVALSNIVVTDDRDETWREPIASLAPGASQSVTFTGKISLDDAKDGDVDNTANVVADIGVAEPQEIASLMGVAQEPPTTVRDSFNTATDGEGCSFDPFEQVTITKSCPTVADGTRIGTGITYTVRITNTGDVELSGLNVTDDRTGGFYQNAGDTTALAMPLTQTLAPAGEAGDSLTLYFTTTITDGDAINGNIDNTVSISANAGSELVTSSFTADGNDCRFNPLSDVEITKGCPTLAPGARVDDQIVYPITLANAGDIPLTVDDVLETRAGTLYADEALTTAATFPLTLARDGQDGDTVTLYFASSITAQDAINGNINNTATVQTAELPDESAVAGGEAGCLFTPVTGIEITKGCPTVAEGTRVEAPISYEITVTNTGDVELSNVVITDERDPGWNETIPSLARSGQPGDSDTVTFTSAITLDDAANGNVDNTASVVADIGAAPEIASLIGVAQDAPTTVDDSFSTATDGEGCPFTPVSDIEIGKSCPDIVYGTRVGDQIVYEITLSNSGDIELTVDDVLDTRAGTLYTDAGLTTSATFPLTLAQEGQPGDAVMLYFASTITAQDALNRNVDNTATVQTVELPDESVIAGGDAGCLFTPIGIIDIDKTCPTIPEGARVGDAITYQVTITNTGDVTLVDIDVDEARNGDYDAPFPTELARGESATRTFTSTITLQDAANGNVDNSAAVESSDAVLTTDIGAETTVDCPFEPVTGVDILKACPGAEQLADARVGDEISYQITVKNIGDVELSNIVVTDDRDPEWSETIASLAPGASQAVTFTGEITFDDAASSNVDNTASVTADIGPAQETASLVAVAQADIVTATDAATANCPFEPFADGSITKSCPTIPAGARVGDAITYEVTITNTGDVKLTGIDVTDDRDGSFDSAFPTELAPGASATRTFTSTITTEDASNGNVDNRVTFSSGEYDSVSATAACPFDAFESVQIFKSCPTIADDARVGDEITYEVTVRNAGDVTLTGIAVNDGRDGSFDSAFPTELAAGESATRIFTSTITAGDAANGNVNNSATVTAVAGGVSENGSEDALQAAATGTGAAIAVTISGRVTANCAFEPVVSFDLDKSCPDVATGARVGDEISYEVTITNTGDVAITGIDISDSRNGEFDEAFPATLDPGESVTRTFTSTITGSDANHGNVDNSAIATVHVTIGDAVIELSDDASVDCAFTPFVDVEVTKQGNGPINAGDDAVFTITVTNVGDVAATDIAVTDELPGALDWSLDPEVEDCAIADGELNCVIDRLDVGESADIIISAETSPERCDDLHNTVTIDAASEHEGATANNTASASIEVDCGEVQIVKFICTVHKDRDVEFEVITASANDGDSYEARDGSWCIPLKGVEFTIDGEQLDAPLAVKTGKDGTTSAILPPGDYTITELSTKASKAFRVEADDTTTIKVFNFTVIEIPTPETPPPKPLPKPTETPEPVTTLPTTGSGTTPGTGDTAWILMVMSAVLCGGAAYALRRRAA